VVIGGGMTAIDIAIQTKKLGAENVTIVYRRGQESMNASAYEQELAQIHGVTIRHWLQPHSLERNDDGTVHSIVFEYTDTIEGRLRGTGEYLVLEADQVFKAIGQNFIQEPLLSAGIALSKGRISVDDERRTSVEGIWAGGDCVAGGQDLTVASVEDGKIAAESIHASLMKQPEAAEGVAEAILAGGVHHTISPNKPATSGSWLSGKQG